MSNSTTQQRPHKIGTEDLQNADVAEVLSPMFTSGVDIKDVFKTGLAQIEQAEQEAAAAQRETRRIENVEVALHQHQAGANLALAGACLAVAYFTPGGNVMLLGLGGMRYLRSLRETKKAFAAAKVRDLKRAGNIVEVTTNEQVKEMLDDSRFDAAAAVIEGSFLGAGALSGGGLLLGACAAGDFVIAGANVNRVRAMNAYLVQAGEGRHKAEADLVPAGAPVTA